jgi:hypothetical protein
MNSDSESSRMDTSSDALSPSIPRLPEEAGSMRFGDAAKIGWRAGNAAWLFAVLFFLVVAPYQGSGAAMAVMALNGDLVVGSGPPSPAFMRSMMIMAVIGLGSCFGLVIGFFAVPWIHGAAAAHLLDRLVFPDRRPGSIIDGGNRYFGRVLVLTIIYWLIVAACSGPGIIATQLLARQQGIDTSQNPQQMAALALHPLVIATGLLATLVVIVAALLLRSCMAALVCEDQGITGAIQRGVSFLTAFKGDASRLLLLAIGLSVPTYLVQQATVVGGFGWSFVAVSVAAAAYWAYVEIVLIAITIVLYLDRRRGDIAVFDPHQRPAAAASVVEPAV